MAEYLFHILSTKTALVLSQENSIKTTFYSKLFATLLTKFIDGKERLKDKFPFCRKRKPPMRPYNDHALYRSEKCNNFGLGRNSPISQRWPYFFIVTYPASKLCVFLFAGKNLGKIFEK